MKQKQQIYDMTYEEAQDYISKRGLDIPWNDNDVVIDERNIMQTVANVLAWADAHQNWISVEDELPERDGVYLFCFDDGTYRVEGYFTELTLSKHVTHWMPIVPPRKED